ncbi:MAG: small acid-soluble spore protein [Sulfobacillus thermosulfidooxidans]|uniref:Spore protein alpha/beta n=1 Tax=Sulfobacillus thermotolerans TaxID=338644 RepID=A0ABN5GZ88_9FIRM|nr:alpha/beta-type small acid-soluble spore protein [Sulfobacillus sp. hq2]AUW93679.1 spore protein alpha/beta [Sulfobacillus thermotolerans]MCY0907232.1 alpha/beta-type small acid-soluble spore protein [Sulfobacillus thermotolerans]POB10924.1 spore protein alpha/beta [Sulfobacillus sp. hq2]PSR37478.1 MAG: small acid-soluble spore protein [Sulfobacillus thermosulfidooxidans]
MARRKQGPSLLSPQIRDQFKYEVAEDLGLTDEILTKGWADMPSRQLGRIGGKIGGNMVKVMIRQAEESLSSRSD